MEAWRQLPEHAWGVTPETARLLKHWRDPNFMGLRPFFCQVEAVETAIWLTEVAPQKGKQERIFLGRLEAASQDANPGLSRLVLKLATGAGKAAVMAMLIAWQTINAVRYPNAKRFTKGFLIVTPGITIRDRLQVRLPNDPNAYDRKNGLVPAELVIELHQAVIVITNFHAFKPRERWELSKGGRQQLQGRTGEAPTTLETEGQMLQRVMPGLMGIKNVLVMNDEAHHGYRAKPPAPDDEDENLTGDARKEAEENNEAGVLDGAANVPEGLVAGATMQQAKGLEYRAVAVIACDEDVLPLAERLPTASDMNELQEVHETERHLLYVAVTRARDELWVSGVAPGSDYLADP